MLLLCIKYVMQCLSQHKKFDTNNQVPYAKKNLSLGLPISATVTLTAI